MKNKKTKNKKSVKILFAIFLACVMMFGVVATSSFATNTDTADNSEKIVIKAKAAQVKITFNANGGKIGTKNTKINTVNKGSQIGKLLVTPKKTGYAFNGWYTKKINGKKISKDTKVTKKITYYAHWTKKLNSAEKSLIGTWGNVFDVGGHYYVFKKDGTFELVIHVRDYFNSKKFYVSHTSGTFSVSKGIVKYDNAMRKEGTYFNFEGDTRQPIYWNIIYGQAKKDTILSKKYKFGQDTEGRFIQWYDAVTSKEGGKSYKWQ
jgi:uncharacterized repeat protein (TIGR02543 family)